MHGGVLFGTDGDVIWLDAAQSMNQTPASRNASNSQNQKVASLGNGITERQSVANPRQSIWCHPTLASIFRPALVPLRSGSSVWQRRSRITVRGAVPPRSSPPWVHDQNQIAAQPRIPVLLLAFFPTPRAVEGLVKAVLVGEARFWC